MRLNQRLLTISAGLCLSLALAGTVSAVRPQEAYAAVSTASRNQGTGWLHKGNQWQYALPDGTLIRGGWIRDGNGWYYFDADGIMVSDTTRDIEAIPTASNAREPGKRRPQRTLFSSIFPPAGSRIQSMSIPGPESVLRCRNIPLCRPPKN